MAELTLALVLAAVVLLARRDRTTPIRIIAPTVAATGNPEPGPASSPTPVPLPPRVQVSGAVGNPGVFTLDPDDRVIDANAAAGGAAAAADLSTLNLAQRVRDEAHYYFPAIGEGPLQKR